MKQSGYQRVACWLLAAILSCPVPQGVALNAEQVYAKVKDSIYTLYGVNFKTKKAIARGSAVAVTKAILATNCHVAMMGNFLVVKVDDTNRVGRLLYKDEKQDLCLVEVPGVTFQPVVIRDSSQVKIGEVVFAVGNPQGTEKTLSQGIISNRHNVDGGVWLQTDATISFGSSGGGLFDAQGELIGITSKMGGNFGFATPTEWILSVLHPEQITPDTDTDGDGKPDTAAPTSLKSLGNFGSSGLTLYRNNDQCFLVMPGKNSKGEPQGLAIWNPRFADRLLVFATSHTVEEALSLLLRSLQEGKQVKNSDYMSPNALSLGGQAYPLYGTSSTRERYAFFVLRAKQALTDELKQQPNFSVQFQDPDPRISEARVTYSLEGVAPALQAYDQQCRP